MLSDAKSFIKELFIEGRNWLFTLFDILGIILFLLPSFAQGTISNIALTRTIGAIILIISLLGGSFTLYRKYHTSKKILDWTSLVIFPYKINTRNMCQLRNLGPEPILFEEIYINYQGRGNNLMRTHIEQIINNNPSDDPFIIPPPNLLECGESARFQLPFYEDTSDGSIYVDVVFRGIESNRTIQKREIIKISPNS